MSLVSEASYWVICSGFRDTLLDMWTNNYSFINSGEKITEFLLQGKFEEMK